MSVPARQNLYRKYRPQRFSELAGQEHISRTIQTAVSTNRISHAYMFSGPRGTGKTSSARLLAKILNCTDLQIASNDLPDCCGTCSNCMRIEDMSFMDIVEIDAASNNGVEDIRLMREKVKYRPAEGKYKIYIIDEVHMLSTSAFNAFLKTLEEPPPNVIFILATTDPQKVPATIISRCQCFDFRSISKKVIQSRLEEIVKAEQTEGHFPNFQNEALGIIAEGAEGGFRDALSLLDQIASAATSETITADQVLEMTRRLSHSTLRDIAKNVLSKNSAALIETINELYFRGYEPMTIAKDLLEYFRCAMLLSIDSNTSKVLDLPDEQVAALLEQIKNVSSKYFISVVTRIERLLSILRGSFHSRILLEAELIRLTLGNEIYTAEAVEQRIDVLEQQIAVLKRLGTNSPTNFRPQSLPKVADASPTMQIKPMYNASADSKPIPATNPLPTLENADKVQNLNETPINKFRKAVSKLSTICNALLVSARLTAQSNGVLELEIGQSFAFDKLNTSENRSILLEAAVATFSGITKVNLTQPEVPVFVKENLDTSDYEKEIQKIDEDTRRKILEKPEFADAIKVFSGNILEIKK